MKMKIRDSFSRYTSLQFSTIYDKKVIISGLFVFRVQVDDRKTGFKQVCGLFEVSPKDSTGVSPFWVENTSLPAISKT